MNASWNLREVKKFALILVALISSTLIKRSVNFCDLNFHVFDPKF